MEEDINEIFDKLDHWRLLPAYQLERRADIFFAIYLPKILERFLEDESIIKIIPEFPISKKILKLSDDNRSFKVDYMVITNTKVFLVELKTDMKSIDTEQKKKMKDAASLGIQKLIEGLESIVKASTSKLKYSNLLKQLEQDNNGWIKKIETVEVVYIQPKQGKDDLKNTIYFSQIAKKLEKTSSFLSRRFAKSLIEWINSPNKNTK
jgi:hypothetical protein